MAEQQENHGGAVTPNFAHAMQSLAAQAEKSAAQPRIVAATASHHTTNISEQTLRSGGAVAGQRSDLLFAFGQMIKPVAIGVESVNRVVLENRQLLTKLAEAKAAAAVAATPATPPPAAAPSPTLDGIAHQLGRIASTESANQKLFDAMHAELKGYKDGFLFDALQKPFIRDLINIYDDLSALQQQTDEHVLETSDGFAGRLAENLTNSISHLLEIFERLDVSPLRTPAGDPVDKRVHRLVSFEPATSAAGDGRVVRSMRPGFLWREGRCVRPEEIIATRWVSPAVGEPAVAGEVPAATA